MCVGSHSIEITQHSLTHSLNSTQLTAAHSCTPSRPPPYFKVGPDVHDFLVGFFEGFPEYKDRDFWITGESYGGTYIPLIMDTIDQMGVITTLKGAAIGNGCTEGSCFSG